MKRRDVLALAGATLLHTSTFPFGWTAEIKPKKRRLLYFTQCQGYEHEMVHREGDELAFSEKTLTEMGMRVGLEVICTKDGRVFDGDLDQYDCIAFYTSSGDLTKPNKRNDPPVTPKGLERLFEAVSTGKSFVGFHAATCSFRNVKPYMQMLGGEFIFHGAQQEALMKVASPDFPGVEGLGDAFSLNDEWYVMKIHDPKIHVILVQETKGMIGERYERPPYPATWAKMHGKGRVFYTSMGHRQDVWTNDTFQKIVLGGLAWALGDVDVDVTPNFHQVTPDALTA
jgi:hypothetical protein